MPKILKAVDLNTFEQAILRSILVKYIQKRSELQILNLEPQKAREEFQKIIKDQDEELKAQLPEEKYNAFIESQKNNYKKPKNKKKKRKKKN